MKKVQKSSLRTAGDILYELTYKPVKRLNLRVRPDKTVAVSVPRRVPAAEADRFVTAHADWIRAAQARIGTRKHQEPQDIYTDEECLAAFLPVLEKFYPLFSDTVPVKPLLKVRFMKSRWGVCHIRRNYITLNKQLYDKPIAALEYVVLHELVHFWHPNHQAEFHKAMARLMPDYKARKALLKP